MAVVIAGIDVAQAATIINVIITILQYSFGLALVALLLYLIPPSNSANSWTVAARQVHSSLWPIVLRCTPTNASPRINFFSRLSLIIALLIAICGIVTPLGLKQGPAVPSNFRTVDASFIEDTSPLGLATSPREDFEYSRTCGALDRVPCPGKTSDTINSTDIPPSIFETFTSTPHGPFNMQFRRYYTGRTVHNVSVTNAQIGVVQSLVLRNDVFAVAGLIVDMSDSPGIGFLNHTVPLTKEGATWSQDTLWLEPVTTCVNTNLTIDYILTNNFNEFAVSQFNLTDRGGFVNLATTPPTISQDGQNINLYEHAYKGAAWSNRQTMIALNNMTRNESYIGKSYPLNSTSTSFRVGEMSTMDLKYLANVTFNGLITLCRNYGGGDNSNITNVSVQCALFAGPAQRTDGGDERIPSFNSAWSQTLHVCASATRASIQTVTFSTNSSMDLSKLQITRTASNTPALWAMEKTNMIIAGFNPLWGRIADQYESDPSLWTRRSNVFYLPAGVADFIGTIVSGQPSTVPSAAWARLYTTTATGRKDLDYSGKTNYAVLARWQTLLATNPELGHAQIRNLIWTDIVANTLVGLETHSKLVAANLKPSVTYDLRYGIPLLIAFILWVLSCLASALVLLSGILKVSRIFNFINHTAVGRLALGHSALAADDPKVIDPDHQSVHASEKDWQKTTGKTPVSFRPIVDIDLQQRGGEILYKGLPKDPVASEQ